jgi:hypothetical protein
MLLCGTSHGAAAKSEDKQAADDVAGWNCIAQVQIDDHFRLVLQKTFNAVWGDPYGGGPHGEPPARPYAYVYWQQEPDYAAQSVVQFSLDPDLPDDLPAPTDVQFGLNGPRLQGGEMVLSGGDGRAIRFHADDPSIGWLAPTFQIHWVKIKDSELLRNLFATDGWTALHEAQEGTSRDLGPMRLAPWAAVQSAYTQARTRMVSETAEPKVECSAIRYEEPHDAMII